MENETQNSVHTNHPHVNGVKDGFVKSGPGLDKGKGPALKETASNYSKMISGHTGNDIKSEAMNTDSTAQKGAGRPGSDSMLDSLRMDDLPDEIQHITTGIMSLGLLLSRLAQVTHNQLQELITTLSTRPFPQNPTADGTPDYRSTTAEDTSPESREKKKLLLDTAEQLHAKWVKALVITEWSRKSEAVGKLIDLRSHIGTQLGHYTDQLMEIAEVKRSLSHARLPSPDLKTALEVLTSGEVSWLPELGYIEPPPLTREQEDRWQEELNTLLSVRLTLYDYEKIPYHFKDYTIDSGRVTFKVKGEFEVDLTIADEDPEKQFWFIDFRFTFTPAPDELTDKTREYLETRVNTALATDSLAGCYRFLHGYTLTHKITEFTRQALELRSGDWADSLKVERLNGAMSIQYWQSRPQSNLKSWIILGVHSGKEAGSVGDRASTSHLSLRWFRDSKELKDLDIPLDFDHISAETTLKTIIAHHVGYILSSIHSKLLDFPRFSKREASLRLTISKDDPSISQLVMSLSRDNDLTVRIDPVTGTIALSPLTRVTLQGERQLNTSGKDPAVEGHIILEKTRCFHAIDELINRGKNMGWLVFQSGVKFDELKPFLNTREAFQTVWIRHVGWTGGDWSVLVTMSLGADKWWLVQTSDTPAGRRIKSFSPINITGQPRLTEDFFHDLNVFTTGMISRIVDVRVLEERGIKHLEKREDNDSLPAPIKLPVVYVRLSDIAPSLAPKKNPSASWAVDFVKISFRGAQQSADDDRNAQPGVAGHRLIKALSDATITVADKTKFKDLGGNVDSDVTFDTRVGEFTLHLRQEIGTSLVDCLATRLQAIGRLVDFVDAMRKSGGAIVCKSATMREIVFSYGDNLLEQSGDASQQQPMWTARLDLVSGPNIKLCLEKGTPHLRVLDLLESEANSPQLRELPYYLKLTFSMLKALESIEDAWTKIKENDDGRVDIRHWSLEKATIQYRLGRYASQQRRLKLSLKKAWRAGTDYWHLCPEDRDGNVIPLDSDFHKALKPIFEGRGDHWRGLRTGAVGEVGRGIEELLSLVDNAIVTLVGSPPPDAGGRPGNKPASPIVLD